ncbi:SDR family NAD(P)-dependent oxidoreductase [Blastococcus sp. SYSU DS0828]
MAGDGGCDPCTDWLRAFFAYASSKAGMHGLGRTVAAAYAGRGIRVNTAIPPYTETGFVSAIAEDLAARAAIVGRIPMRRAGTPADLEGVYVFLAGDESAFVTGGAFAVDSGMTTCSDASADERSAQWQRRVSG